MPLRFIRAVMNGRISLMFIAEEYFIICIYLTCSLSSHPLTDMSLFPYLISCPLWMMLLWTWDMGVQILQMILFSFPVAIYAEVGLLNHVVLIFWGTYIMFSIVAPSICIPINSAQGFPFFTSFPTFVIPCLFDDSLSNRWEVISPCSLD